jgi:drug/metabolite transporter (DMT)-like permease
MPCTALTISSAALARGRGPDLRATLPTMWRRYLLAGVLVTVAYTLVLAALMLAPVGYVAMLRESSVVLGALAGWLVLKERLGRHRLVSSLGVAGGMILLILAR